MQKTDTVPTEIERVKFLRYVEFSPREQAAIEAGLMDMVLNVYGFHKQVTTQ